MRVRKPQYGITKQLEYRDLVFGYSLENRDLKKRLVIASLGGRDAIWDLKSTENKWLNASVNSLLTLVERGRKEADILIRDLGKQGWELKGTEWMETTKVHGRNFIKTFKHPKRSGTIQVCYNTMKGYLRWCVENNRVHDILNLDYYDKFAVYLREDIAIIKENGLVRSGGDLFVTAPDPKREINTKAVKETLKHSPTGIYSTAMLNALRKCFSCVKSHPWQYRNSDNLRAIRMNVIRLRLA